MPEVILCEKKGAVTTITLNRPDIGNLMSNDMARTLAAMLDSTRHSHVVVLKGAGKNFCLGRDLPPPDPRAAPTALDVRQGNAAAVLELYGVFRRVPVPVVGVVTGGAIGLGCALAAACDVTFSSDDARFQVPEMRHDIPPCLAMSALIGRVPHKAITYLIYSTDEITAEQALAIGLVNRVVPTRELKKEVDRFIGGIVERSLAAVQTVKEFMRSAPEMDAQGASDFAGNLLANVLASRRAGKR